MSQRPAVEPVPDSQAILRVERALACGAPPLFFAAVCFARAPLVVFCVESHLTLCRCRGRHEVPMVLPTYAFVYSSRFSVCPFAQKSFLCVQMDLETWTWRVRTARAEAWLERRSL